ncbi:MAG: response regulator [Planctomycetes bacterium]|nr:response regulator [Planctomycetota bacterium]
MARRIFIVDDDKRIREIVAYFLKEAGYETEIHPNGEAAIEAAARATAPPDCCVFDIVLPGIDGYTLSKKIHETPGWDNVPILFVSGNVEFPDSLVEPTRTRTDFLVKPFERAEFIKRIRILLGELSVTQRWLKPRPKMP